MSASSARRFVPNPLASGIPLTWVKINPNVVLDGEGATPETGGGFQKHAKDYRGEVGEVGEVSLADFHGFS